MIQRDGLICVVSWQTWLRRSGRWFIALLWKILFMQYRSDPWTTWTWTAKVHLYLFPHTHSDLPPIVILESEVKVKVAQSCPTLCRTMDYTVHGILQTSILEWVAVPFSRGLSQSRDRTQVSHIAGGFFTTWARREVILECHTSHGWLNLWIQRVSCKLYMDWRVSIPDPSFFKGQL